VVGANRRAPRSQRDREHSGGAALVWRDGNRTTGAGPGLHEDAAATTAVLDEGGPAILVAHSYGGMVASQAGEHPAVRRLVYISSFLPRAGENLGTLSSGPDPVPVTPHADGSVSVNDDDTAAFDGPIPARRPGSRPSERRPQPPLRTIFCRLRG
jgi:pimeloyl-ACP methyl ester carboxylesterase